MTVILDRPESRKVLEAAPFHAGDRLSRAQFERLYAASNIKKAELVEGIVYMPSPTRFEQHGRPHSDLITWLGSYRLKVAGTTVGDNVTVRLDFENEVQPDALLRLDPALGGRCHVSEDDYLEGPPELVVEIAASSASYDMHQKRRVYARNGVPEYIVLLAYEQRVVWFVLREGIYEEMSRTDDGILCSDIFPGLWLDPAALLSGDLSRMLTVLGRGTKSVQHQTYITQLKLT